MERKAIDILDGNRIMAIATTRADGWPQSTLVGYANEGLLIYFLISRFGQKFANIGRDDRVSIAIGGDFEDPRGVKSLSIAAYASEVRDEEQRRRAYDLLKARRPALAEFPPPDFRKAALMRARCSIITVSDYSLGFGHADLVTVDADTIVNMTAARPDDWGLGPQTPG